MSVIPNVKMRAGVLALASWAAYGQSAGTPRPSFEVASIKPAAAPQGGFVKVRMGGDKGRIDYSNVSLKDLIRQAYQVMEYQITGPDWLNSARFDVTAKIPDGTSDQQKWLMMQSLLEERFHLALHRESKELPMYALVVAKGGPKLKVSEVKEGKPNNRMMMRPGHLEAIGISVPQFIELLARQLGRPVLDKTDLKGSYDFTLSYTMDENQRMEMMGGLPAPMGRPEGAGERQPPPESAEGPSLFAAVQEQLGLKLEPRKGPVASLVIDRVDRVPTEN
jgi:uncharacterized protein (TIGR03435 family)